MHPLFKRPPVTHGGVCGILDNAKGETNLVGRDGREVLLTKQRVKATNAANDD